MNIIEIFVSLYCNKKNPLRFTNINHFSKVDIKYMVMKLRLRSKTSNKMKMLKYNCI